MLLRTQLLYNLPLIINDTSLLVSSGTSCLNLFQPIQIPPHDTRAPAVDAIQTRVDPTNHH